MAELISSSAQSAVDSLLGRLTRILEDEAKLLSGVHGDVQFIRDEMESMNGFLLHLVDVDRPDHQVQAWMWQVKSLARDSENSVDRYMKFAGGGASARYRGRLLGPPWRLLRFLWTLRARHQVATQIRELRCRAQDVGERRLRYGVVVPVPVVAPLDGKSNNQGRGGMAKQPVTVVPDDANEIQESRRRALLDVEVPGPLEGLLDWLVQAPVAEGRTPHPTYPRVITVLWPDDDDQLFKLQQFLFENPSVKIDEHFNTRALNYMGQTHVSWAMEDILKDIVNIVSFGTTKDEDARSQTIPLEQKVNHLLSGKRYLLVLSDVRDALLWPRIKSAFCGHDPSSAIVLTTRSHTVALSCSPCKVFPDLDPLVHLVTEKAYGLVESITSKEDLKPLLKDIVSACAPNVLCLKAFLHALYADPQRSKEELGSLRGTLSDNNSSSSDRDGNTQKVLVFWYDVLPIHYKRCLMYLSIYPKDGGNIRRTSMVRRWVAENLITGRDGISAEDQAERCFRMLLAKGFVLEEDISSTTGKFKTFKVNSLISEFVNQTAREERFVDADLQPDFSHRVSVHNRSELQQALVSLHGSRPNSCWNWNISCKAEEDKEQWDNLTMFLESTSAFARMGLLKVLDLEGYDGLREHHLVNICKIFKLRYLNLRRTKITKLPKEIDNLQQLETLDIRETNVSSFATKSLVLPMLKHMLAGPTKHPSDDTKSFSTVRLPRGVGSMTKLQILCHVDFSGQEDRMNEIGKLLQLRKLGVVFRSDLNYLKQFLWATDKLNQSLVSLSIHVKEDDNEIVDINMAVPQAFLPPKFLQCLSIHGTTLPRWIEDLNRLAKLTLCQTRLVEEDMKLLAKLKGLRCLMLHKQSYEQTKLTLKKNDFQNLTFLLIQGCGITDISFDKTPMLEEIVWCFKDIKSISGVCRLPSLKRIELKGERDYPAHLMEEISQHPNQPHAFHNERRLC